MRRSLLAFAAALWLSPLAAQTVAVIDTGVDATVPALSGRIAPGGRDFIDGDNDPDDEDPGRHGTTVALIIADVAGNALILPVRVLGADGEGPNGVVAVGVGYAAGSSARVINMSLGDPNDAFDPVLARAIQTAARNGKIIVVAAGNEGGDSPVFPARLVSDLAGAGIAVGALTPAGDIADFSNRAGSTMEFYLLAPGFSRFSPAVGTSFAAPQVAGAAAAVLAQNPALTAQQVVEILLESADDLGEPGVDPVYGQGRLNLAAALQPVGEPVVPSGGSGGGSGIGAGALVLGAGVALALLTRNRTLAQTLVLDRYDRPYLVDLGAMTEVRDPRAPLGAFMRTLATDAGPASVVRSGDTTLDLRYAPPAVDPLDLAGFETTPAPELTALSLRRDPPEGLRLALEWRRPPGAPLGEGFDVSHLWAGGPAPNPFLGFGEKASNLALGYRFPGGGAVTLAYTGVDEEDPHGPRSESVVIAGSFRPAPGVRVDAQLSRLSEQGSLLGGAAGGPYGVDAATTLAAKLGASVRLGQHARLTAHYARGITRVDDAATSVLHGFSALESDAWGLGLTVDGVFRRNDRLALGLSRPLRVDNGAVDLEVPHARDAEGNIYSESERVDLAAPGAELDLEASYLRPAGRRGRFGAYLLYRRQPLHDPAAAPGLGAMATLSTRW